MAGEKASSDLTVGFLVHFFLSFSSNLQFNGDSVVFQSRFNIQYSRWGGEEGL